MQIIHDLHEANFERDTVLTIGAFDGLHLGHQDLLRRLVRHARQTYHLSGVVTFDPHPRTVLTPQNHAICLISMEDKLALLQEWGLDLAVVLPFTQELARTSARDFVQTLVKHARMTELWIGWDFHLGRGREGDVTTLKNLGQEMSFAVHVIEPVTEGDTLISSTHIRSLLGEGRVREAAEMLGRYPAVKGHVVAGSGEGSRLGFPTANVRVGGHCLVPPSGVYAGYLIAQGQRYPTVINIGGTAANHTIDAHLLDLQPDLRNQEVTLQFVDRLRDELHFDNDDDLRAQIIRDVAAAHETLS